MLPPRRADWDGDLAVLANPLTAETNFLPTYISLMLTKNQLFFERNLFLERNLISHFKTLSSLKMQNKEIH